MKHSESMQHLAPAFMEICGALSNPARNRTVTVKTSRGAYEFSYATLDTILDLLRPVLHSHKCGLTQVLTKSEEGVAVLETRLLHESGEWLASEIDLVLKQDNPQAVASTITYYRRYALCALFPIAGLEDDAGSAAEGHAMLEGRSTQAKGESLTETFLEEYFGREDLVIAIRDNDWKQWRSYFEKVMKACKAPPVLIQVWNDNKANLESINRTDYSRLVTVRNKLWKEWSKDLPLEWQDGPAESPELPMESEK